MDTRFGRDIDPDSVTGARGRSLDAAYTLYNVFHKKVPLRVAELEHDFPKSVVHVGDALAVMYRTDKWKEDGVDEDYKHLHDEDEERAYKPGHGVKLYLPTKLVPRGLGGRSMRPPVQPSQGIALLGKCLGFFARLTATGEIVEIDRLKHSYLFSIPSGKMLAVYAEKPEPNQEGARGFLAILAGGKLRVIKDGIDG
jgi:hypothetical protein